MNNQECASYDIHYIQAHYTRYFETLEIISDSGDSVSFRVKARDCSR